MATREHIRRHCHILTSLRRRRGGECLTPPQTAVEDGVIRIKEEKDDEEEEESEVLLALSESSSSAAGSVAHVDDLADPKEVVSESEQEVMKMSSRATEHDDDEGTYLDQSGVPVLKLQVCRGLG